jgi:hypothetical protein
MKQKHFIDSHKGATPLIVVGLMSFYEQWENTTLWVYLGTHGLYGVLWVLKSMTFGDKQWERRCGLGYGLVIWGGLTLYWIAPWLIASRATEAPPALIGVAVAMFGLGVFYHFASDMQKHTTLALRKGLFTDGLWARTRNPNYFGELLIYAGFSLLAMHWIPFAALGLFVAGVWIPNMIRKDKSISRYPEFAAYKARSGLFFPRLF